MAAGLGGICLSLAAASAAATDYELNPWFELGGGYNYNVLLAPSGVRAIGAGDGMADVRVHAAGAGIELEVGSHA